MAPGAIAIVLIAALAHVTWNLVSTRKRGDTVVFVTAYTTLSALLCLPFAIDALASGAQPVTWVLLPATAVSALLHATYSLTLQAGYDRADLGVVYPVARGLGPLLTMLIAVVLLGERPSPLAAVGGLVVLGGVAVVTGNPLRGFGPRSRSGLIWGALTGATIAGYTVWDAYAIVDLGLVPVAYYSGTLLIQVLLLLPSVAGRHGRIRECVRLDAVPILAVAVLSPLAYILVLIALQSAPVTLVAPLREVSIVIGSLLAWRLFDQGHHARRVVGAIVVLVGIVAISA